MVDLALILSAGKGERMRPLTLYTPKPLLRIWDDIPIIAFPFYAVRDIKKILVNAHWLKERINEEISSLAEIIYEEELLGTGGTIKFVFEKYNPEFLLVLNGDTITNFNVWEIISKLYLFDNFISLIVVTDGEYPSVELDYEIEDKIFKIKGFYTGREKFTFCGIHLISGRIKNFFPEKKSFCIVKDVYMKIPTKILAFKHSGFFFDVGTPQKLQEVKEKIEKEFLLEVSNFWIKLKEKKKK